ncbi:hypothetical protein BGZ80_001441 [Entomortierella chlamydospora]|uniref:RRM domain-containing protein n=1 Tax=Entomortierella chlamydospora TaxID=101097 RepID=A0A9P6MQT6_9FUNG|nr:hypothetical protein BGZ79_011082 [Entomortierella chlamydospora]KAG0010489.1 hypothetical protein BGZ80_001441 [Entomortierella chlamydospora]
MPVLRIPVVGCTPFVLSSKVFVGGLSWGTTEDSLRREFEKHGSVIDASVVKDRETGRSRGFGFVTFADEVGADNAIQVLNDTEFEGRRIKVDRASENSGNRRGGNHGRPGRSDGDWGRQY